MENEEEQVKVEKAYLEIINYQKETWDNLIAAPDEAAMDIKQRARAALGAISKLVKEADIRQDTKTADEGIIEVQYNPASLSMQGTMESRTEEAEEQKRKITTITSVGVVKMTVELLFGAESRTDTGVMEQMTKLLTMMRLSPTKQVRFSWGKMQITGKVICFEGSYNMFYGSGLPAAGKIKMTIQSEAEAKKIEKKISEMTEEHSDREKKE